MTTETRNAFNHLKEIIQQSNPNPRYGVMIEALNALEATLPTEEVVIAQLEEVKAEIIHEMQELGATEEQIENVVEEVQEVIEEVKTPKKKSSKKTTTPPTE
jgi:predicted ribosome quality control (RQC) complex YloA/Tae2 family protein